MGKSFRCRDAGVVCDAEIRGETDEDVLTKAVGHARDAHGVDLTRSRTLMRYAHSVVRDDATGRAEGR